ncbi:MAG: SDR family NAD(P)-dependent oxidoreductase [Myxococcales bacterium]|nr:SDR family NAD(P)-dependent oxidoreductase [Myxococcales bacterium]
MSKPDRRHVLVTGASSGIGEALARDYARAGHRVTVVARRLDLLEALAAGFPGTMQPLRADLSEPSNAEEVVTRAAATFGPVDVLLNNAGAQIVGAFEGVAPEDGEMTLRLNLLTPLRLIHAVLPAMRARGAGAIVNIASVAGLVPTPGMAHYCASKAGLAFASESLRSELRGSGIVVVTVYPGPVETAMMRAAVDKLKSETTLADRMPAGDVDTLSALVRAAVTRRQARVIYPKVYGATRWFGPMAAAITGRFTPVPTT